LKFRDESKPSKLEKSLERRVDTAWGIPKQGKRNALHGCAGKYGFKGEAEKKGKKIF
jgi:hypothetical protein